MASILDEMQAKIKALSPEKLAKLQKEVDSHPKWGKSSLWTPNPGPQFEAYNSLADVLFYGGAGGGGKSDLGIGLAFGEHQKSLILRRRYSDIGALIDRAIEINGTRNGFNGTPPPILRTTNGKIIQFGANQHDGDESVWQGRAYDLKIFDEVCHFLEKQIRFHLGWIRSTDQKQRCRAVLTSNPPINSDGDWIIGMFRAWLDLTHANPAASGELRWFVTAPDGTDLEIAEEDMGRDENGRLCTEIQGKKYIATSRTFIPAKLSDNPSLANTDYQARLDALPEPIRSAVRDGNFVIGRKDADNQLIPTQWIMEAQTRWHEDGWKGKPMSAMAFDPAGGGKDAAELMSRHGYWFGKPITKQGEETADGSSSAATIIRYRRDSAAVIVDVGGGYGGSTVLRLKDNGISAIAYDGSYASSAKTKDRFLCFANKRAEACWRLKEALDPDQQGGSQIALPPDAELRSDLASLTYEATSRGILIESKDKLRARLGRSPGKGDAAVMLWSVSDTAIQRLIGTSGPSSDPRSKGLPQFAKRRQGPLTRKR